jgi:hypothetical protein
VPIAYFPFAWVGGNSSNTLNLKVYTNENGTEELISDESVESNIYSTWEYPAEVIKNNIKLTFVLSNDYGDIRKTVTVNVTAGSYNFEPVAGDSFSFIPRKYSNNAFVDNKLTIAEGVTIELSNNFNLNAGGFGKETGTYYFKIPAYNRIRLSGKGLFNENHDCHFKLVFKTKNARYNDVPFFATGNVGQDGKFTASTNGVKLTTNHGYV